MTVHAIARSATRVTGAVLPALIIGLLSGCGSHEPAEPEMSAASAMPPRPAIPPFRVGTAGLAALERTELSMPDSPFTYTAFHGASLTFLEWRSDAPPPAELTPIVIAADRDKDVGIYLLAPDGSWITRLTPVDVKASHPSLSPDGTRMSFTRGPHPADVWVSDLAARSMSPAVIGPEHDGAGAWSPTGAELLFRAGPYNGPSGIGLQDVSGLGRRALFPPDHTYRAPDWCPDGRRAVYCSDEDGDFDIYIANIVTGLSRRLTNHPGRDDAPAWSPDGTEIVFVSDRSGWRQIHIMNVDGSNVRQLTYDGGSHSHPEWSPDGRAVAYRRGAKTTRELRVINVDGTDKRTLLGPPYRVRCATWIVRRLTRVFIGSPGADAGFDPPLVEPRQAVIVVHDESSVRSVVGIGSAAQVPVRIRQAAADPEDTALRVAASKRIGVAESVWISLPPTHHLRRGRDAKQCRISFDPQTGRVASVKPR